MHFRLWKTLISIVCRVITLLDPDKVRFLLHCLCVFNSRSHVALVGWERRDVHASEARG